jgi:hypothetical protein
MLPQLHPILPAARVVAGVVVFRCLASGEHLGFRVDLTITRRTALIAWSSLLLYCHMVVYSAAVERIEPCPTNHAFCCFAMLM